MYLHLLNEKQKSLFMKLAVKATETNGAVTEEEKEMLGAFAKEMQICPVYSVEEPEETILQDLYAISSSKALRIIAFEILGIMFSDMEYDKAEESFVAKMTRKFEIPKEDVMEMVVSISEYASACEKMTKVVFRQ